MHTHGAVTVRRRAPAPSEPSHHSMTLHATSQSDSELRSPQERVKYVMLGGSKVVVGTSIASYDLIHDHGAVTVRCRAPAPSIPSHLSTTLHATSQSDYEL